MLRNPRARLRSLFARTAAIVFCGTVGAVAQEAAPAAVSKSPAAAKRLTPELLWKLRRVSDPQISPDGRVLLYHVRTYDVQANGGTTQLYLRPMAGGEARQFTSTGSNWSGRFAPDGKSIAFMSTRSGSAQIWRIPLDGGEAKQVTDVEGGVGDFAWSPTGEHFSFVSSVKLEPVAAQDFYDDLPLADAKIYDSLLIRHWDHWRDGSYSHLFVVSANGGEPRDLMPEERVDTPVPPFGGGEQIAWSPDGRELCYTAKKVAGAAWAASTDNDLWVVPIDGSAPARNLTKGQTGYDQEPRYSPDGRFIAYSSMRRAGFEADRNRIMVLDRATNQSRELTAGFDQSAHGVTWAPNGQSLYFDSDIRGTTQLYRVELAGGKPVALTQGRHQFRGPVPTPDGKHLLAVRQRTERPYEIVRLATNGVGEGEMLTDENGALYESLQLPKVEERFVTSTDGAKVHCWVIYPPNFDPAKKWPMLTYCQGGPQSQVGQWFSYRWNFHLMAAQGYVVLAINRRGLPGFGQEWNDAISRDWGGQAMQDLLAATDAMFEEPYIDRKRTAAIGASFGGYSVYWLMGHDQKDRFATMIAHCGVFHLESMYLSTEELFFVNHDLGGPYWQSEEIAEGYRKFSPHRFVGNWDTPLLVIHGEKDFRVPVAQGLQAFTAAQIQGVPSRFLYFPNESHWVLSPQNGLLWHRVFFDWLDRYCKPD